MGPEFAHLHVASSYSLRYGTATPAALAARAAGLGMSALALTDRDGLFGVFKHVQACADAGIKPLLGADLGLCCLPGGPPHGGLPTPHPPWPPWTPRGWTTPRNPPMPAGSRVLSRARPNG